MQHKQTLPVTDEPSTLHIMQPQGKLLINLQALRFVAAMLVVICHLILFSIKFYPVQIERIWSEHFMIGVDIFFVISGFIMVYTTFNRENSPVNFLKRRFFRIYPTYWLLSLTIIPVLLLKPGWVNSSAEFSTSILHSLLLIPHEGVPLIMVAWSLEFEMLFYLLFAATLFLKSHKQILALAGLMLVFVWGGIFFNLPENPFLALLTSPLLLEFAAGMGLGYWYCRSKVQSAWPVYSLLLAGIGALFSIAVYGYDPTWRVLQFGLPASAIVAVCLWLEGKKVMTPHKLSIIGGDISYPLYLIHVLVIAALGRIITAVGTEHIPLWAGMLAMTFTSIASAYIINKFFEKPFGKLVTKRFI